MAVSAPTLGGSTPQRDAPKVMLGGSGYNGHPGDNYARHRSAAQVTASPARVVVPRMKL